MRQVGEACQTKIEWRRRLFRHGPIVCFPGGPALRAAAACLPLLILGGCVSLHHVQFGEIDNTAELGARPFDLTVEYAGLDEQAVLEQIAGDLASVTALFQMGPRTGIPRRVSDQADGIVEKMYEVCPSGEITGVTSRRETLRVPFAGVERIHITGYCLVR